MDKTISATNLVDSQSQSRTKLPGGSHGDLSSHHKRQDNNSRTNDGGSFQQKIQLSPESQRQKSNQTHLTASNTNDRDNENSDTPIILQDTSHSEGVAVNNGNVLASERVVYDVEHLATFSTNSGHEASNKSGTTDNKSVATGISANDDYDDHDDGESNKHNNNANSHGEPKTGFDGPDRAAGETDARHLANYGTTPKIALQRLFELEKQSGIWTQHMQIELREDFMFIIDCETNSVVERFNKNCVTKAEAFNHHNDIYNNIVVFIIRQSASAANSLAKELDEQTCVSSTNDIQGDKTVISDRENPLKSDKDCDYKSGELHIFQCVSHQAQELVDNILDWKSRPASGDKMTTTATNYTDPSGQNNPARGSHHKLRANGSSRGALISKLDSRQSINIDQSSKTKNEKSSVMPAAMSGSSSPSAGKPMLTMATCSSASENSPIVNVNVKETVQVFNQIAALREKGYV